MNNDSNKTYGISNFHRYHFLISLWYYFDDSISIQLNKITYSNLKAHQKKNFLASGSQKAINSYEGVGENIYSNLFYFRLMRSTKYNTNI